MEIKEWDVGNQWEKSEPCPESIKLLSSANSISSHRFSFNKVDIGHVIAYLTSNSFITLLYIQITSLPNI